MLYALGSPISVHWGSMYEPHVPGAWMQNVVVSEPGLKAPWDSGGVAINDCFGNRSQTITAPGLSSGLGWARATATFDNNASRWNRRVWHYRSDPAMPVLRIRDEFGGAGTGDPKIFSLTLMATGPVEVAGGSLDVPRSSAPANPPGGGRISLASGVTRLGFKGQWGVDFDVYIVAESAQEATITGWKHFWHTTRESVEYEAATGKRFEEAQYILRLRSRGAFEVVIVPYRAGTRPSDLAIARTGHGELSLIRDGNTTTLSD
jgi:hypothetical protein